LGADAANLLKGLGFRVVSPNYNRKGHVFDQNPEHGKMLPQGSTITLIF
jgi:hypothetical protein